MNMQVYIMVELMFEHPCTWKCLCVCTCGGYVVYIVVVSLAQGLRSVVQAPLWQFFCLVFHQPPPAPPVRSNQLSLGTWHLLGCKFKTFTHKKAMVQVGLRVPTLLAVRRIGLFSSQFLDRLQELCLHDL